MFFDDANILYDSAVKIVNEHSQGLNEHSLGL
jgi:hypothetical protein